jgi:hypothetical protein
MALLPQVAHPLDVASVLLPVNVGQDVQRLEDPAEVGQGVAELGWIGLPPRCRMRITSDAATSPACTDAAMRRMSDQWRLIFSMSIRFRDAVSSGPESAARTVRHSRWSGRPASSGR